MSQTSHASLLLSLFLLSGCISVPSPKTEAQKSTSIYSLHSRGPDIAGSAKADKGTVAIVVPKPELPPGFATERIALHFEDGRRHDYYADAKWSSRLDDLLQDFIIQTMRRNLPGKVVDTPDFGGSARFRMVVKITDFQPVYRNAPDSAPRLDVAMTVTLIGLPGETVKTQFSLKNSAPAAGNTLTLITKGLEELLQSLTDQAVQKAAPNLVAP